MNVLGNFKTALASRRIRQVELARKLKIPASTLSEIICGRRQADPTLRARIAKLLRADEAWLFSTITQIPSSPTTEADKGNAATAA